MTTVAQPEAVNDEPLNDADVMRDLNAAVNAGPFDEVPPEPTETPEAPEKAEGTEAPFPESEAQPEADAEGVEVETVEQVADPFAELTKAGKPLTYAVNGSTKTHDGILEVEGKGAVIPAEHLARVRDQLQRADRLSDANQALYTEVEQYKALGGVEGFEKLVIEHEQLRAVSNIIASDVMNPNKLAELFIVTNDGLRLNQERYNLLMDRMRLARDGAQFSAQKEWSEKVRTAQESASAPQKQEQLVRAQVEQMTQGMDPKVVAEITEFVGEYRSSFLRPATPQDVEAWPTANFRVGETILDVPKLAKLIEGKRSAPAPTVTAQDTARKQAERDNAKRIPTKSATPAVVAKKPSVSQPRDRDGKFVETPRAAKKSKGEFYNEVLSGRGYPDDE